MVDLHLHSNMSDGTDTPPELLEKVISAGCKVFSVTDHDDLRANAVILSAMKEKKNKAKFITGCEISSVFEGRNLHLLCYGFDPEANSIKDMIAKGAGLRRQRITAMFGHLKIKHGIVIPDEDRAEILSREIPGKMHITDAAMKLGIKIKRQDFFDNYLDDMESREFKIEAVEVIKAAGAAGGVVSFAHPVEMQKEYKIDFSEIAKIAQKLKGEGLTAIEAYHTLHEKQQIEEYKKIAGGCGLLMSGGSDYHGKNDDAEIGRLTADGDIPSDNEITILSVF